MKRYFLAFALLFAVALAPVLTAPALAAPDDDLIILDEGAQVSSPTNAFLDFLQRSLFLSGGGYWAGGLNSDGVTQAFAFARLGFDYSFDIFGLRQRVYVAGGYSFRSIALGLTFSEGFDFDANMRTGNEDGNPCQFRADGRSEDSRSSRECKFSLKVENDAFELREAYGSFEIFPDFVVNVGRQRPTWGQFTVFSVINSTLPIETQSKEFGISNANLRMPQDMLEVNLFLFESIQLSGYAFYGTTLDPLLKNALGQSEMYEFYTASENTPCGTPDPVFDDPPDNTFFLYNRYDCSTVGDGGNLINQDEITFAGRALWRSNYLTLGFTYNQGYFSLFNLFARLPRVEKEVLVFDSGNSVDIAYNVIPRIILPSARSYGGEVAIPLGNWTIKGEVVYIQSQADIGLYTASFNSDGSLNNCAPDAQADCMALFEWVVDSNKGRGFVEVATLAAQVGVEADYDSWNFGINVLIFQPLLTGKAERANKLYKAAYQSDTSQLDGGDFDGIPFPTAYVFYNFGEENKHRVGLVGGFLGIVAGVNAFYTGPLYFGVNALDERINWTVSADYTTSLASQLLSDTQEGDRSSGGNEVALTSTFALSFRAGAVFEF